MSTTEQICTPRSENSADLGVQKTGVAGLGPGLGVVAGAVTVAWFVSGIVDEMAMIVVSVLIGALMANAGLVHRRAQPGLAFAATVLLRGGIVLIGLRLAVSDIAALGGSTVAVIVGTVLTTFVSVQVIGRRLGLSQGLSLLVASGFSICGNSAIASINGVTDAESEEVAAAVALVTLCGTAAIFVVPTLGAYLGLDDTQLGVWVGASVQDTAQVVAVAANAGPAVLAVATAVKLTRVLLLAPIVAGLSVKQRRAGSTSDSARRPPLVPGFVLGFLAMLVLRSTGLLPLAALETGRTFEQLLLAAGMVGLGASVRLASLRRLGMLPLVLGAVAWLIVGSTSIAALHLLAV